MERESHLGPVLLANVHFFRLLSSFYTVFQPPPLTFSHLPSTPVRTRIRLPLLVRMFRLEFIGVLLKELWRLQRVRARHVVEGIR